VITPEEILSIYGVNVTTLSAPYSSYYLATTNDLWLRTVGAPGLEIEDLIIITPDDYRSNIYAYKIPSRHVNLTGPDVYFYIYHPSFLTGTLEYCIKKYLEDWAKLDLTGNMTFSFDEDYTITIHIYVSKSKVVVMEGNSEYEPTSLDSIFAKWGKKFVVQSYVDITNPDFISYYFVGDK
jgi:hypothetical protein